MNTKNGIPIREVKEKFVNTVVLFDSENVDVTNWYKRIQKFLGAQAKVNKEYHCIAAFSRHNQEYAFSVHDNRVKQLTTNSKQPNAADDLIVEWYEKDTRYYRYVIVTNDKLLIERLNKIAHDKDKYLMIIYTNKDLLTSYENVMFHHLVAKD